MQRPEPIGEDDTYMTEQQGNLSEYDIIVVDDDDELRGIMTDVLEEAGYAVREASSGAEAVESLNSRPSDLIISDIFMPDMDGIELTRTLFKSGVRTRLLAISGHVGDVDYLSAAKALGATRTLRKPFKSGELLAAVESCLSEPARPLRDT